MTRRNDRGLARHTGAPAPDSEAPLSLDAGPPATDEGGEDGQGQSPDAEAVPPSTTEGAEGDEPSASEAAAATTVWLTTRTDETYGGAGRFAELTAEQLAAAPDGLFVEPTAEQMALRPRN